MQSKELIQITVHFPDYILADLNYPDRPGLHISLSRIDLLYLGIEGIMVDPHEHQRSAVESAIEATYLEVTGLEASIETNFRFGRGAETDLFEKFYFHLRLLYRLTCNEGEMINNAVKESEKLKGWLELKQTAKDSQQWIKDGLGTFAEYDKALHTCGIIVLPHRAR